MQDGFHLPTALVVTAVFLALLGVLWVRRRRLSRGFLSEEDRITECRMCHRPMHPRVHGVAAPVVPDGHVIGGHE